MKLAIVCHPTHGGSGVVASELGMHMARRGHEVHFVSYQLPFRVDHQLPGVHFHEVEVTSYPLFRYPPYALALATKLVSVVRQYGVKLIHAHYALPHSLSAVLAKQMCADCGIRSVTTLHGTDITIVGGDHSFAEITRFGILGSDAITAVSQHLATATRQDFDVNREIEVIPNFVDLEEYSPARHSQDLRRRFARDNELLIAHVSNFRPVKRVQDVAEVFAGIAAKRPARLLMVGTGPDICAAEDLLEKRGVRDKVTFEGAVTGVADLLAVADLFLLPSDSESFGLAALEAMACGVPVVGAAAGGLPEVVAHGESGYLCPVGDTQAMTEASLQILEDASKDFGEAARARVESCFEMNRVVNLYEESYRRVLSRDPITWTQNG